MTFKRHVLSLLTHQHLQPQSPPPHPHTPPHPHSFHCFKGAAGSVAFQAAIVMLATISGATIPLCKPGTGSYCVIHSELADFITCRLAVTLHCFTPRGGQRTDPCLCRAFTSRNRRDLLHITQMSTPEKWRGGGAFALPCGFLILPFLHGACTQNQSQSAAGACIASLVAHALMDAFQERRVI